MSIKKNKNLVLWIVIAVIILAFIAWYFIAWRSAPVQQGQFVGPGEAPPSAPAGGGPSTGFVGPTGAPHVNGPTAPPPQY